MNNEQWAARLARVTENQRGTVRPPPTWGHFRAGVVKLEWLRVGPVWRRYWPDGCEQPVTVYTGTHRCRESDDN